LEGSHLRWSSKGVELEGRDDSKVRSCAAQSPEEVRVLRLRNLDNGGVGQNHGCAYNPVHSQPVRVGTEAKSTVKRMSSDTDTGE